MVGSYEFITKQSKWCGEATRRSLFMAYLPRSETANAAGRRRRGRAATPAVTLSLNNCVKSYEIYCISLAHSPARSRPSALGEAAAHVLPSPSPASVALCCLINYVNITFVETLFSNPQTRNTSPRPSPFSLFNTNCADSFCVLCLFRRAFMEINLQLKMKLKLKPNSSSHPHPHSHPQPSPNAAAAHARICLNW